jgi:anthranilate phosphoribosyltransferase
MVRVLEANGALRALVVYGHDGLDELTTTSTSTVVEFSSASGFGSGSGEVRSYVVDPGSLGLKPAVVADLLGGDAATNALLARRVLDGQQGPHRDIVLLNAAAGLVAAGQADDLATGLSQAALALDSGAAMERLEQLISVSQALRGVGPGSSGPPA